jgi:TRAP-type C4-dicarboxylate transport system substrate-binding protein
MLPFSVIVDFRLGEVARGYTIAGPLFGRSSFLVAMNRKRYESLSPAARAAIDQLSGRQLSLKATEVYLKRSAQGVDSVRGKGEVVQLTAEEQKRIGAILRPIISDWIKESEAKGIPASEMLKRAGYSR